MSSTAAATDNNSAPSAREATIRTAIALSNTNALRMALYQLTGDAQLAAMRLVKKPVRGGAQLQDAVSDADLAVLTEKAVKFLLDPPAKLPPLPSEAETRAMLKMFSDKPVSENYLRFGLEELAFAEYPRDVRWTNKPSADTLKNLYVIVVGGGISGITTAIQLKRIGIRFKVIERQSDIGGTWQLNQYPEARVDTTSPGGPIKRGPSSSMRRSSSTRTRPNRMPRSWILRS